MRTPLASRSNQDDKFQDVSRSIPLGVPLLFFAVELEQSTFSPRKVFVSDVQIRIRRALFSLFVVAGQVVHRQHSAEGNGNEGDVPPLFHFGCVHRSQSNHRTQVQTSARARRSTVPFAPTSTSVPRLSRTSCGFASSHACTNFLSFGGFPRTYLFFPRRSGRHGPFRSVSPRRTCSRHQGPPHGRQHLSRLRRKLPAHVHVLSSHEKNNDALRFHVVAGFVRSREFLLNREKKTASSTKGAGHERGWRKALTTARRTHAWMHLRTHLKPPFHRSSVGSDGKTHPLQIIHSRILERLMLTGDTHLKVEKEHMALRNDSSILLQRSQGRDGPRPTFASLLLVPSSSWGASRRRRVWTAIAASTRNRSITLSLDSQASTRGFYPIVYPCLRQVNSCPNENPPPLAKEVLLSCEMWRNRFAHCGAHT